MVPPYCCPQLSMFIWNYSFWLCFSAHRLPWLILPFHSCYHQNYFKEVVSLFLIIGAWIACVSCLSLLSVSVDICVLWIPLLFFAAGFRLACFLSSFLAGLNKINCRHPRFQSLIFLNFLECGYLVFFENLLVLNF